VRHAGLYRDWKELGELVGSYQADLRESSRVLQIRQSIVNSPPVFNLRQDSDPGGEPPSWTLEGAR